MKRIIRTWDSEGYYIDDEFGQTDWYDGDLAQEDWDSLCNILETIRLAHAPAKRVKIDGSIGRWDGRRKIHPEFEETWSDALERCTSGNYDKHIHIEQAGEQTVYVTVSHHDGTNRFRLTCYK